MVNNLETGKQNKQKMTWAIFYTQNSQHQQSPKTGKHSRKWFEDGLR